MDYIFSDAGGISQYTAEDWYIFSLSIISSMKTIALNRPALWRSIRSEETSIRKYSGAYPYMTRSGIIARSTPGHPVFRYAKNFRKFKEDFSLFMFSDESDVSKVESFFASHVKKLSKSDITETLTVASMSDFKYLDTYYGDNE